MAFRLSGRFRVIVAICPTMSRISVEYINCNLLSIQEWSMRVFCANFIGHFERLRKSLRFDAWVSPRFAKRREHVLCGDVADQIISSKRAPAKPGKGAIKTPASRFVRRQDFFFRILRPAVQMHTKF